jgi:hypothetical protein
MIKCTALQLITHKPDPVLLLIAVCSRSLNLSCSHLWAVVTAQRFYEDLVGRGIKCLTHFLTHSVCLINVEFTVDLGPFLPYCFLIFPKNRLKTIICDCLQFQNSTKRQNCVPLVFTVGYASRHWGFMKTLQGWGGVVPRLPFSRPSTFGYSF